MRRDVYVISDLHLGGAWPSGADRGFRMMTRPHVLARFVRRLAASPTPVELVINGDFVDFLAEPVAPGAWVPFRADALATFEAMLARGPDAEVYAALRAFTARAHALTVLLGNHDLELSLPDVRAAFEAAVSPDRPLRFVYDGEGYVVGTALIEHGNRYDGFNVVDHGALRALRASLSRGQAPTVEFVAPPGSRLVAEVMNPLKAAYPFVDLLKPENAALFALIAAIEPGARAHVWRLADLAAEAKAEHRLDPTFQPHHVGEVADWGVAAGGSVGNLGGWDAADEPAGAPTPRPTDDPLADVLAGLDREGNVGLVSTGAGFASATGLLGLLVAGDTLSLERRLPLVKRALRALEEDRTFDPTVEPGQTYADAARALARGPDGAGRFTHVVFGHTHHACAVDLGGATYLNSGTWANLMRFPSPLRGLPPTAAERARELADPTFAEALPDAWWLRTFVADCRAGNLDPYVTFRPSCVHLAVEGGRTEGRLVFLDPETGEERPGAHPA